MQRGMLNLTKEEIVGALTAVRQSTQTIPLLLGKLELAKNNGVASDLEISEDEVEIILDNLPLPKENATVDSLRVKLSQFLAKFRF